MTVQAEMPKEKPTGKAIFITHDCHKRGPMVVLTPGIDPAYLVGTCPNCKKQVVKRKDSV